MLRTIISYVWLPILAVAISVSLAYLVVAKILIHALVVVGVVLALFILGVIGHEIFINFDSRRWK